jgi:hypothetical protein
VAVAAIWFWSLGPAKSVPLKMWDWLGASRHPGGDEIVLDHRDPAVGRVLVEFAVGEVGELILAELVVRRVGRAAGIGVHELRLGGRGRLGTHELAIVATTPGHLSLVGEDVIDGYLVGAAPERVPLGHLDTAFVTPDEVQGQRILAVSQREVGLGGRVEGLVRGSDALGVVEKSRLGDEQRWPVGGEQLEGLVALIRRECVGVQARGPDGAAASVDFEIEYIGAHSYPGGAVSRRSGCRRAGRAGSLGLGARDWRLGGHGRGIDRSRRPRRDTRLGRGLGLNLGLWTRLAVVLLPCLPYQHQHEHQGEDEDQANVVH